MKKSCEIMLRCFAVAALVSLLAGCSKGGSGAYRLSMEKDFDPVSLSFSGAPWESELEDAFKGLDLLLPLYPVTAADNQMTFSVPVSVTDWEADGVLLLNFETTGQDAPYLFTNAALELSLDGEKAWTSFVDRANAYFSDCAGENPDFAGLADSSYSYISVSPEDGVDAYFGYTPLENVENPDLVLAYGGNYRIRIVAGKEEKPGRR